MSEVETPAPVVFVDTETTGVGPDRVPWEVAVVRRDPDGRERKFEEFLPLTDVSRVDGFALRVGRFWDRASVRTARHGRLDGGQAVVVRGGRPCGHRGDL